MHKYHEQLVSIKDFAIHNWPGLGFAFVVLFPSTAIVQKYFGGLGLLAYILFGSVAVFALHHSCRTAQIPRLPTRWMAGISIALLVALIVIFQVGYPVANSGRFGPGSDRDEALNIATGRLLHGQHPYGAPTYLNNPITPMPGSLVLAIPFYLIGNAAYQNIVWLMLLIHQVSRYLRHNGLALITFTTILLGSPIILQEYVTGGDLLANSIFVTITAAWLIFSVRDNDHDYMPSLLSAALFGIALSSRPNFLLLLPLLISALYRMTTRRRATLHVAMVFASASIVTFPIWAMNPEGFTPFHVLHKFDNLNSVLPYVQLWIPLSSTIFAVTIAFRRDNSAINSLLRNCTFVLAFPVIVGTLLYSIASGQPMFGIAGIGLSFMFFGLLAFAPLRTARRVD